MLHEPAPASPQRDAAAPAKARVGLWLFGFYCAVYAGFVAINLLKPAWMKATAVMGLNLAVTYGFGLIVMAIVLGLIYSRWCSNLERQLNTPPAAGDSAAKQGGSK